MADTPQTEGLTEQESKQTENLPSEALYMDFETAMSRAQALFEAIWVICIGSMAKESLGCIQDLADLGKNIITDQLNYHEEHGDEK